MTRTKHTLFAGISMAVASLLLSAPAWADKVVGASPANHSANKSYKVAGKRYYPSKKVKAFTQTGKASWYGSQFHGRKTSSGERFNMNELTAAHPTMPILSYARVTSLDTGKAVVVRINDRGPFHGNRVIDLSRAAAKQLGFVNKGTANVRIEQIMPGQQMAEAKKAQPMYVSLASFNNHAEANDFAKRTNANLRSADSAQSVSIEKQAGNYVVRMGPFPKKEQAAQTAQSAI